ncbi:camp-binding domain-like protein [Rhizoclosmatium globosum]|uniref:Camp-binding domain-like protein n=1 Tax=Rhizoclosmatium globosum TaxID=329046 RepID=A0A1Y2CUM0_9FUNG|nr:camp-binding domain-like protein [Rhizoclosmatium globosum]|eukprot:ORY50731.1 camp-binding domain-like protein [Rhizoclosmatium globosum]
MTSNEQHIAVYPNEKEERTETSQSQALLDKLETQTTIIDLLKGQYNHIRKYSLDLTIETEEVREILKQYLQIHDDLKQRPSPTKEEQRITKSFERAEEWINASKAAYMLKKQGKSPTLGRKKKSKPVRRTNGSLTTRQCLSSNNAVCSILEESLLELETEETISADVTVIKKAEDTSISHTLFTLDEYPNMETLLRFPLFEKFPPNILQLLCNSSYEMNRKMGQVLVRKGDEGAEIFFLVEGIAAVVVDEKEVSVMKPVTFFGEMGVLFEFKRTATVVAKTDCVVVIVTKQKLNEILSLPQHEEAKKLVESFAADKESWWKTQHYVTVQQGFGAEFAHGIAREEIKKLGIFASASDSFCDSLSMRVKCIKYQLGENIINIGEESEAIYFLLKGSVEVIGPTGAINAEIASGSFFGEVGVLLNMKRTATIRAKEECNIFRLSKQDLDEVVVEYPSMKAVLKAAADERFEYFKQRTTDSGKHQSSEHHTPDQFDLEVGSQSLAKLGLFKGVELSVLSELSMKMIRKSWESGSLIIKCDTVGTSMFFLAAGNANIISEFDEVIDSVSAPSAYFGEVAILEQVPRTASIKCTSVCSTYELKKEDFAAVMERYPEIAIQIKATAHERMQNYLMRSVLA